MAERLNTYLNGLTGSVLAATRVAWRRFCPVQVLAQSGVAITAPANDTNENALVTLTIPAGTMLANDSLRIYTLWSQTNSGNTKTYRYRLGGVSGTQFLSVAVTTVLTQPIERIIMNRGSVSSQITANQGNTGWNTSSLAVQTGTVDMSVSQDLVISAQKATGTETVTLEAYCVLLIRSPV
jgi:hypothetical protein